MHSVKSRKSFLSSLTRNSVCSRGKILINFHPPDSWVLTSITSQALNWSFFYLSWTNINWKYRIIGGWITEKPPYLATICLKIFHLFGVKNLAHPPITYRRYLCFYHIGIKSVTLLGSISHFLLITTIIVCNAFST